MDEANLERPVRECMSTPVETIDGDRTIADVATILWNQHIGALVVGSDDAIEGIVTESDVVRSVGAGLDSETTPVREIMTEPVVTVEASAPLQRAISRMNRLTIKKLPVIEDDDLVGILTTTDVTSALAPDLGEVVEHIQ